MKSVIRDIAHEIKEMKTDRSSVRKFGIILSTLLLLLSGWLWHKEDPVWVEFGASGLLALLISFLATVIITPVYKVLTVVSIIIGYFVSRIILTIVFIVCFAPVGIVTRILRKDLLDKRLDKSAKTYWIKRDEPFQKENCERLF